MDFFKRKTKLKIILLATGLAAALAAALYFGYRNGRQNQEAETIAPETEEVEEAEIEQATKLLAYKAEIPIRKRKPAGEEKIEYLLEGSFLEGLAPQPRFRTSDGRLEGRFVFRGDTLGREIPVVMGVSGRIMFGRCEGSFKGTCRWAPLENGAVAGEVAAGEPVQLKVIQMIDEDFTKIAAVVDGIYREFEKGEFTLEIPEGFSLYAEAVGVVR